MFRSLILIALIVFTPLVAKGQNITGGMRVGDYSVVIGKKDKYNQREWTANSVDRLGYIKMNHMEVYEIKLKSNFYGNSDALVEIDGNLVGVFRVRGNSEIILERSKNNPGRFTFIKKGTREFYDANLHKINSYNLGLIKVRFYPQKLNTSVVPIIGVPSSSSTRKPASLDLNPGGTGVTGNSNQLFVDVPRIQRDYNRLVTINLRLVEEQNTFNTTEVRPLNSIYSVPQTNQVPPPVE